MSKLEQVTADEAAYHAEVCEALAAAQAVARHWSQHLGRKYGLTQGDRVTEAGVILRASQEAAGG